MYCINQHLRNTDHPPITIRHPQGALHSCTNVMQIGDNVALETLRL